jgi:hypothetical protein
LDWFERYGTGRCINCGFLDKMGFENRPPQAGSRLGDIEEVLAAHREHGSLFQLRDGYPSVPHCYRGAVPLHVEFLVARFRILGQLSHAPVDPEAADRQILRDEVLARDRGCPKWMPWTAHRSPHQHFEELKVLELERRREQFERQAELHRQDLEHQYEVERRAFDERMDGQRRYFDLQMHDSNQRTQKWMGFLAALQLLWLSLRSG